LTQQSAVYCSPGSVCVYSLRVVLTEAGCYVIQLRPAVSHPIFFTKVV